MRVLHLHPGPDTGGQSMAGKAALEAAGDEVRVFVHGLHTFGYPKAELWDPDEVHESYRWADVVVIHNDPAIFAEVDDGTPKPLIVHHHGSRFRGAPTQMYAAAEAIGARQIVSTVDLLLSVPPGGHAEWMPQVVDVEHMARVRASYDPPNGRRLRVAHAPTNKMIKGTRHVTRAMRRLAGKADYILIQRQPWWVCLMYKASADIFVDQLNLGYGNNAIEAWAMGMPVLSGAPEPILARMRQEFGGLPFFPTSAVRLQADLRSFFDSAELRDEWTAIGRAHVDRFHAPAAWVERTRRIYAGDRIALAAA